MDVEQLRVKVYRTFAETGCAPSTEDLTRELDAPESQVKEGLRELAAARHLALDVHDSIAMAHPFSAVPPVTGQFRGLPI